MIAKDESLNLGSALTSFRELVDEVVVVDTGSTDNTRAIAESHGARVYDFAWCDDFAAARNESIARARCEWILFVDADDRIDQDNAARLARLRGALADENVGYVMRTRCLGLEAPPDPIFAVRLFRNDPRVRWIWRVHEQIAPAIHRAGGTLRDADVVIDHVGYQNASTFRAKLERNLTLIDLDLVGSPHHPELLLRYGGTLLALGRAHDAIAPLTTLRAARPRSLSALRLLSEAYARCGDLEAALAVAETHQELGLTVARCQAALGRFEEAVSVARNASDQVRALDLQIEIELLSGRPEQAELLADIAIDAAPSSGSAWVNLGVALVRQGKTVDETPLADMRAGPLLRGVWNVETAIRTRDFARVRATLAALQAYPHNIHAHLAALRLKLAQNLDIEREIQRVLDVDPFNAEAHAAKRKKLATGYEVANTVMSDA